MNKNKSNNIIYGKKINDYFFNESELNLLKTPIADIFANTDQKKAFMLLFKKIFNLVSVHKNIINMFESFDMSSKNSIKKYASSFDYSSFLNAPQSALNQGKIGNISLSTNNQNYFKKRIRSTNVETITNPTKIDKSVLILFLLFQKLQSYLTLKKAEFNQLMKRGVHYEDRRETIKKLNGFKVIAKKFLKIREKLFKLIQYQYVEPPIVKDSEVDKYYYYYHFLRNVRETTSTSLDYDNYKKSNFNNSNNKKMGQVAFEFNSTAMRNKFHIYNLKSDNSGIDYSATTITHTSGTNVPNKDGINIFNLISLYYKDVNSANSTKRVDTIITKRNNIFYKYEYEISGNKIMKSAKPQQLYFNDNALQNVLLENTKDKNGLGTLSRIYISLTNN
jgi:hypothetical protein